jgi:predicted MPP superfamily phosphohydrolase
MNLDPAIVALEPRLGTPHFRHRLQAEQALLLPLRRFSANPRTNAAKLVLSNPFIQLCFRLAGLHQRGYAQFLAPRRVEQAVPISNLPPALHGLTILHLSDLHLDLDPRLLDPLVALLANTPCDLVVITGDFRNLTAGTAAPCIAATLELLQHLQRPAYAVLGNHDPLEIVPPLERAGLRFLLNEHVVVERGDAKLVVAGVDDAVYYETHDLQRALAGAPRGAPRVLLSHSPAIFREAAAADVQLLLAGHTHGGQICLPGGRVVITSRGCPRDYMRGAWTHGQLRGYTSPGTGACGVPLRFHCPAEVTRHRLERA